MAETTATKTKAETDYDSARIAQYHAGSMLAARTALWLEHHNAAPSTALGPNDDVDQVVTSYGQLRRSIQELQRVGLAEPGAFIGRVVLSEVSFGKLTDEATAALPVDANSLGGDHSPDVQQDTIDAVRAEAVRLSIDSRPTADIFWDAVTAIKHGFLVSDTVPNAQIPQPQAVT